MKLEKANNCTEIRLTGQSKKAQLALHKNGRRFGQEHKQHIGTRGKRRGYTPQSSSPCKTVSWALLHSVSCRSMLLHAANYQNKQAGEMLNIHQAPYRDCRSVSKIPSIGARHPDQRKNHCLKTELIQWKNKG